MNFSKFFLTAALCTAAFAPSFAAAQTPAPQAQDATPEALAEAYENGRWSRAIMLAEELLKAEPENANYLTILGVAATNISEFERAEGVFEKVQTLRPDDALAWLNLCGVRGKLKRDNTIETCLKASEKNPENAALWQLIGQEYENAKRMDEARDAYLKAYQLDPKNLSYLTAVTAIDFSRKDYDKALEMTEKAIEGGNDNVILYLNAIVAANRTGAHEKALALADRGYERYHDPQMMLGKAEALNGLHRFEEAIPIWKTQLAEVKNNHQNYPRIQYGCARALIATACTEADSATCGGSSENDCCARERQALELLTVAKDHTSLRKIAPEFDEYLGLAYILNGKLEDAEAVLTAAQTNDIEKNSAGAPAALAVALSHFSDEQDRRAAQSYYLKAADASQDVRDADRFVSVCAWPPRFAQDLKKLQASSAKDTAKPKSGCGCEIAATRQPAAPVTVLLGVLLSLFALVTLRRKSC